MGEGLVMTDKILPFKPAMEGEQVEALEPRKPGEKPGANFKLAYPTEAVQRDKLGETKQWIAKGLLAKGECSRWIAPPKMMKSALLSSAMNHLGAGVNWQGFKVKRTIGGIYFALERPALTLRRLVAEQIDRNWSHLNLPIRICKARIALSTRTDVQALIDTINRTSDEMKQLVEFITMDTSAKLIAAHGGDEQQAKDNALVWGNLAEVRLKTGVHSAVIGHMGKDTSKGERGSNSTLGDADVVISISGDDAVKTATVTDANDLAEGDLFSFTGKKYVFGTDEDGDEDAVHIVDSVVAAKPAHKDEKLKPNERTMFRILHSAGGGGLTLEEWNKQAKEAGIGDRRRSDLYDLRSELVKKRLIREYGGKWRVNHG
jgi:hypothetical protein